MPVFDDIRTAGFVLSATSKSTDDEPRNRSIASTMQP